MREVLFLHGCGLREKGHGMAQDMLKGKETVAADVSTIFRQASGVFEHIKEIMDSYEGEIPADR